MSIRIVLADDHTIVLQGLKALISIESDIEVVDTCTNGREALEAVAALKPDVLVIDEAMPQMRGIDTVRELRSAGFELPAVILSASIDDDVLRAVVRMQNVGIVLKESAGEDLVRSIRAAHGGERTIPPVLVERALALTSGTQDRADPWPELTQRELDVVREVAKGHSNKKIAKALELSEGTVKLHLHSVFQKLGVSNRVQLALIAQEREPA